MKVHCAIYMRCPSAGNSFTTYAAHYKSAKLNTGICPQVMSFESALVGFEDQFAHRKKIRGIELGRIDLTRRLLQAAPAITSITHLTLSPNALW